jgi:8-oxo-dGTP pyrophosphatase MutT (NUDIX family)
MEKPSYPSIERGETQPIFLILEMGTWSPDAIAVSVTEPGTTMKRTSESEQILGSEWNKSIENGLKPWPKDGVPTRYRLAGHRVEKGSDGEQRLLLTLDPTVSYRDAFASQADTFKDFLKTQGSEGKKYEPIPLAVSTVIIARDAHNEPVMMLTERKKADYKLEGFHASLGGFMEIAKEVDPTATAIREAEEETGITKEELLSVHSVGLVYNPYTLGADLIYVMETETQADTLLNRQTDEENEVFFIPLTRHRLEQWFFTTGHAATAAGLAAIILVGKEYVQSWQDASGAPIDKEEWARKMLQAVSYMGDKYTDPSRREELEKRDIRRLRGLKYHVK